MASNNHQKVMALAGSGDCPDGGLFAGFVCIERLPSGIVLTVDK